MHARLVMFALGPGTRQIHDRLVERFAPALRSIRGFRAVTFGADYEAGEYLSLSLWDSKADADASQEALWPQVEASLGGIVIGSPIVKTFEVHEPEW
jgi:heme-degrading monooxygenase HmoA